MSSERGELTIPGTSPAPPDVPTFYSKAEQVANEKVPTNASGDQILATLRNNGVKENEIGWMGLDDYLKGKPKVSKADLQQFIKENQIQLEETTRGTQRQQLQAQRDNVYAAQNRMFEDLKWDTGKGPTIGQWLRSSDEAKAEAIQRGIVTPERLAQFQKFDDLGKQIADLDMKKATLQEKPTKYEQYTLPGEKSNYTEKLLTLPTESKPSPELVWKENHRGRWAWFEGDNQVSGAYPDETDIDNARTSIKRSKPEGQFQSSHFEEPNILAHVRYDDRPAVDGKKTLFLEELQSDWHQRGKIEGYQNPAPTKLPDGIYIVPNNGFFQVVNREGNPLLSRTWANETDARNAALEHYGEGAGNQGVPDAPFKSDWHELVMKRMLRHAAENGYDRIAWTTGDQQAARYDLSKHVQSVEYYPNTKILEAYDHSGKRVISQTDVEPKELPNYIGKEAAAKLSAKINEYPQFSDKDYPVGFDDEIGKFVARDPNGDLVRDSHGDVIASSSQTEVEREIEYMLERERNQIPTPRVSGLDLKVGGEWARALYDRAIPNFLKGYTKKWGGKVGTTTIQTGESGEGGYQDFSLWMSANHPEIKHPFDEWVNDQPFVDEFLKTQTGTEPVHSIDITPAMKKAVMKTGQPISRNVTPPAFDWRSAIPA